MNKTAGSRNAITMSLKQKTTENKKSGTTKTEKRRKKAPPLDYGLSPVERQEQRMNWLSSKESGQRPSVTDVVIQRIFAEKQAAYRVLPGIVPEDQRVETILRIDEWDRFPNPSSER